MLTIALIRCFPHIVNLSCKAVLKAITKMDLATRNAPDYVPSEHAPDSTSSFLEAIRRDPIATVRTLVRTVRYSIAPDQHSNILLLTHFTVQIRASSIRRQYFSEALAAIKMKDYQLLRDIDIRWSSTLLMVDRAILLKRVHNSFCCGC